MWGSTWHSHWHSHWHSQWHSTDTPTRCCDDARLPTRCYDGAGLPTRWPKTRCRRGHAGLSRPRHNLCMGHTWLQNQHALLGVDGEVHTWGHQGRLGLWVAGVLGTHFVWTMLWSVQAMEYVIIICCFVLCILCTITTCAVLPCN